jgi:hypothetical protein
VANIGSLIIDLIARTGAFETDMGRAAKTADKRTKEIERSVGRLAGNIKTGFAAVIGGFSIAKVIEETSNAELALANLNNAVEKNGGAAGVTTGQLADLAGQLQSVTTYSDEAIEGMQALLLRFKEIKGDEFKRAERASIDLATALNTDLATAAQTVGRALADPEKGATRLARAGIILTKATKDTIKTLTDQGKTSEAQGVLLKELEARYGGAADAARNTFGGAIKALNNAVGDLLEAKSGLPGVTSQINEMTAALSSEEAKSAADSLTSGLLRGLTAVGKVATAVLGPIAKLITAANDLGAVLDNKVFGKRYSETEFQRIFGVAARGTGPSRRRTPANLPPVEESAPSEEFTKQADKLREQIALYGKTGQAARVAYEIQTGALDELSKSEQNQLLLLAKQYDATVASADAAKKQAEAHKQATEALQGMVTQLEEQVATYDQGETAIIRYRLQHGDLAKTMSEAGDAAFDYEDKLVSLTNQLEVMADATEGAKAAIEEMANVNLQNLEINTAGIFDQFEKEHGLNKGAAANEDKFGEQARDATFDALKTGISSAMTDGAKSGWEGFRDAGIRAINDLVATALTKKLLDGLLGTDSQGTGQWGWVAALAGAFGGARATGGPVSSGTMYQVNEREPEFFKPNTSGKVIPLSKMPSMGAGPTNISVSIAAPTGSVSMETQQQVANRVAAGLALARRRNG